MRAANRRFVWVAELVCVCANIYLYFFNFWHFYVQWCCFLLNRTTFFSFCYIKNTLQEKLVNLFYFSLANS